MKEHVRHYKIRSLTCKLKYSINNYQANLVSIHSEEEHQFLVGLNGGFPWLGGRRDPRKGNNFVWSDGTPWDYSNWAKGQASVDRGDEDCAHMWERNKLHKWSDQACSVGRTFVCKKGKSTPNIINFQKFQILTLHLALS